MIDLRRITVYNGVLRITTEYIITSAETVVNIKIPQLVENRDEHGRRRNSTPRQLRIRARAFSHRKNQ